MGEIEVMLVSKTIGWGWGQGCGRAGRGVWWLGVDANVQAGR